MNLTYKTPSVLEKTAELHGGPMILVTVRRIVNGTLLPQPLLDVNVATFAHRGMLGTALVPLHYRLLLHNKATSESNMSAAHVFLYFTQAALAWEISVLMDI